MTISRSTLRSAFQLSGAEVQTANERTLVNIKASAPPKGHICPAGYLVEWGQAEIMEALGIEKLAQDDETSEVTFRYPLKGKEYDRYATSKNKTNRPLNVDNMAGLLSSMLEEKWAITGETLIFDESDQAASCQHRLVAAFIATLVNPDLKFTFIVVSGIAIDVIDFIDTGKSRDLKDTSTRHTESFLPLNSIRTLTGTCYTDDRTVRAKITSDIKQAISLLYLRGSGKDVNASTTEYKNDKGAYFAMLERFAPTTFEGVESKISDAIVEIPTTTLELAAQRIYGYDSTHSGHLNKVYGRGKLLAALILASNADNPSDIRIEDKKIRVDMPDNLAIDLDLVDGFCSSASDPLGPFAAQFTAFSKAKGKLTLDKQYKMGALVNAIKHYIENRTELTIPAETNEAGAVIREAYTQASCSPMVGTGIPTTPRANKEGKIPPLNYPHFGGYDIGMVDKDSLKASAAIEEAIAEATSEDSDE